MAEMKQNLTCRQALAGAFQALSDEAIKAGWPEGDVALALAELAEEQVIAVNTAATGGNASLLAASED